MIDLQKVQRYYDFLSRQIYDEGESPFHKELTTEVVKQFVDPLDLPKNASILDLGCGPGYFLDEMSTRGYTHVLGVTLSPKDIAICQNKGHHVRCDDFSFLLDDDESVDFIFLRHALEHSPFPIFSLLEFNRVLRSGGKLYIEVPAPNCERKHEYNPNHYSIMDRTQLIAQLMRSGFVISRFEEIEFSITGESNEAWKEHYYCLLATRTHFALY